MSKIYKYNLLVRALFCFGLFLFECNVSNAQNNGTISGGATYSADVPNALSGNIYSLSLDGINDYVNGGGNVGGNGAISLWFKADILAGYIAYSPQNTYTNIQIVNSTTISIENDGQSIATFTVPFMSAGTWYNLIISRTQPVVHLYLNGSESSSGPQSFSGDNMWPSVWGSKSSSFFFKGKMAELRLWDGIILSPNDIAALASGTEPPDANPLGYFLRWKMNEGSGTTLIDCHAGAEAFISASGITDESQKNAIRQLVLDLKNAGLWDKMKAIYPFVGATAFAHKWNLKDPRDLDAAYRLTFTGTIDHSTAGVKWDGSTGYANTHCEFTNANQMNLTYYSKENSTSSDFPMGVYINSQATQFSIYFYYDNPTWIVQARTNTYDATGYTTASSITDSRGLWTITRTSGNANAIYQNGVSKATSTAGANSMDAGYPVFIGARNLGGQPTGPSSRQCAFASMGDYGLTSTEAAALNQAVNTYLANITATNPPPTTTSSSQWITSGNNIYNSNTGSVGIGTGAAHMSDENFKLFVAKGIRTEKLKVDVPYSSWPDFVFDRHYKFPSLTETEKFIRLNQHLPGIPSAKEMSASGIDVGANQALLLQKIEELTLFLIHQNKKIEKQNKKIEHLQRQLKQIKK